VIVIEMMLYPRNLIIGGRGRYLIKSPGNGLRLPEVV
jgi:hypothetical protein